MGNAELDHAMAIKNRLTAVLNDSGKFWVEASEIDGATDVRLTVSDKTTGRWFTVEAETDDSR
jgi:hypothetical protein